MPAKRGSIGLFTKIYFEVIQPISATNHGLITLRALNIQFSLKYQKSILLLSFLNIKTKPYLRDVV